MRKAKAGREHGLPALAAETVKEFFGDNCPRLAAALAYYTAFAVAPMLLVLVALVSLAVGAEGARDAVLGPLRDLMGPKGGELLEGMVENADDSGRGAAAATVGAAVLVFGATGAVVELQESMNVVWGVPPVKGRRFLRMLRERFLSIAMVLGLAFLMMVSLAVSAAWDAMARLVLPSSGWARAAANAVNTLLAVAAFTALIGAIYRILPDARIAWRDVWVGAAVTAVLMTVGKVALGLYLGRGAFGSAYGAAGSLAVFLAWVYYASLIFFLGAEFTQVYADRRGSLVRHKGAWPPLKARRKDVTSPRAPAKGPAAQH